MKILMIVNLTVLLLVACGCQNQGGMGTGEKGPWNCLFNGKDLTGWQASENQGTFTVEDGRIKVHGHRSHLFYVGPVEKHDFTNFEFEAKVMTTPGSNSGIYFHTEFQQDGWPKKGYESQVNISHSDAQKSGGLYGTVEVTDPPAQDNQWHTQYIKVEGKHVIVKINDQTVVDYIEPDDVNFPNWPGRKLSHGTFCLQGHDPDSIVYYKDIKVRPSD